MKDQWARVDNSFNYGTRAVDHSLIAFNLFGYLILYLWGRERDC